MKLKNKLTEDWKTWIRANIQKGVDRNFIFNTLIENGYSYKAVSGEMKFEPVLKHDMSADWKKWLELNLSNGHDKDGLFKVLMMNGFSFDCIKSEMKYQPCIPLDKLKNPYDHSTEKSIDKKEVSCNRFISSLKHLETKGAIKVASKKLEIYYIDNFITSSECEILVELIKADLKPSELASPDIDHHFRTSKTNNLSQSGNPLVKSIDERISVLLNLEKSLGEPLQGQFYEIGQEFKPHTDFFEDHEVNEHGIENGQRSYTVMIYLNSTEKGGETSFPLINKTFKPKAGRGIIWCNLNHDYSGNEFSMHHAKKVKRGYKAVITKWFRTGMPI